MTRHLFAHARTAFWYGLQQLPMEKGQKMLLPEYICEVVLHPLEDLGIQPVYYPVDDDFAPDWDVIEEMQTQEKVNAFLLVHYFGQPQDIYRARIFCDKHGLWFIEDNSHGHGGTLNGQPLGSFGDMGFSSPRKQLQSTSGGMLYLQGKSIESKKDELQGYPVSKNKEFLRHMIRPFPRLKAKIRNLYRSERDYSDPSAFPEIRIGYFKADRKSVQRILDENWIAHAIMRRNNWQEWSKFAIENGLIPVWAKPHPESCPWMFPVCTQDSEDRVQWLQRGWRNGVDVFSWPTLPEDVIKESSFAVNRWKHFLCFPLHRKPS
jgi:perosamine synthetase